MSPDIEWHVGEDAEQETIAQVTSDRPSRWRRPIVLIVAALGAGAGRALSPRFQNRRNRSHRPSTGPDRDSV